MKKIGIIGCVHGNEKLGKQIIGKLKKASLKKEVFLFFIVNKKAMKKNKRFIDIDLNRCFPGKKNGKYEERLAAKLVKKLKCCDYVIDLHSTKSKTDNFIIITKPNKRKIKLANKIPLKKLVIMESAIAKGGALIDHVKCGVSIEFSHKTPLNEAYDVILECLNNILTNTKPKNKKVYSAYGRIKKGECKRVLKNFKKIKINKEAFYPILFREKEYTDTLCLKAHKTTTQNLFK